jgi:trimethylamine--corrinoid protein Co-methyltransferase
MKTTISPFFTPEGISCDLACAEIERHYCILPVWGTSGASDAKLADIQAAAEATTMLVFSALPGANLIHDVGYLELRLSGSLEMLLLADEVIGVVRRILRGMRVTKEALGVRAIDEVSPTGNYLTSPHTLAHFRNIWHPRWFDHGNSKSLNRRGGLSMRSHLRTAARKLLESHHSKPLPDQIAQELDSTLAGASSQSE